MGCCRSLPFPIMPQIWITKTFQLCLLDSVTAPRTVAWCQTDARFLHRLWSHRLLHSRKDHALYTVSETQCLLTAVWGQWSGWCQILDETWDISISRMKQGFFTLLFFCVSIMINGLYILQEYHRKHSSSEFDPSLYPSGRQLEFYSESVKVPNSLDIWSHIVCSSFSLCWWDLCIFAVLGQHKKLVNPLSVVFIIHFTHTRMGLCVWLRINRQQWCYTRCNI